MKNSNLRKPTGIRKALLLCSALLFPVTMLYFSPGIVFRGARLGILSGSYLTFALLFLSSIILGRAWCGFLCPGGGFGQIACSVNNKPFKQNRLKTVKFVVWIVWLMAITLVVIFVGGGFHSIDPFLGTKRGISLHSLSLFPFYYMVVGIILALSFSLGRRGFCHTLCWMAPFMILGRALRNAIRTPALQLTANPSQCTDCGACRKVCPMSLPVPELVAQGMMEHRDCILCGECVRACMQGVLIMEFGRPEGLSGNNRRV
jgi:ferredoxin-type protein NapH